jgi:hypothetical protein
MPSDGLGTVGGDDHSRLQTIIAVASGDDAPRWLELALHSYAQYAEFVRNVVVVTNDAAAVHRVLANCRHAANVTAVLTDESLLSARERRLGGWQRQQLVKLRAWTLTGDRYFIGADVDALLIRPVGLSDVLEPGHADTAAVLYYHMFPGKSQSHVEFEQQRIEEMGALLRVPAPRTLQYTDFILDFFCFDREILRSLGQWMDRNGSFIRLLRRFETDPSSRTCFGEWTAYALYALDILHADIPVRNGGGKYFAQLYRAARFQEFKWGSKIVHFVDKTLASQETYTRLTRFNLATCE